MDTSLPPVWLDEVAAVRPGDPALDADGVVVDYAGLAERAGRASALFAAGAGIRPGDRCGLAAGAPGSELVAGLWGLWRMGAAALPLGGPPGVAGEGLGLRAVVARWSGAGPGEPSPPVPGDGDSEHTLVLTSGSSGRRRAVVLTAGNVVAAVAASRQRLGNGRGDRWLAVLPLVHVGGLSILWRSAQAGGCVVLHRSFDARAVARALQAGEVTIASLVPTMLYRVLEVHPGPYPPLRAVLLGGAAAPRDLVERGLDAGLPVLPTYGMTETCSQVATVAPGEERAALGTAGAPLPGITVRIQGADGRDAPPGAVGEILVSGPQVAARYADGTRIGPDHRTGDLGRLDRSGRLVVVGRGDDLVVTGGENVAPAAVEAVLATHPGVVAAAVVGVADPEWGEVVAAAIVPASAARLDEEGMSRFAAGHLPPHERPRRWAFLTELPLLGNGKVDRAAVRALFP